MSGDANSPAHVDMASSYAAAAFKVVPLLNGAAALGTVHFIGQLRLEGNLGILATQPLAWAVGLFGVGALFGGLVPAFSYLSQAAFMEDWRPVNGVGFRWIAIVLAALGYLLFAVGLMTAVLSLTTVATAADRLPETTNPGTGGLSMAGVTASDLLPWIAVFAAVVSALLTHLFAVYRERRIARKRTAAWASSLKAEVEICAAFAEGYLKGNVDSPLYRLPIHIYSDALRALIEGGTLDGHDARKIVLFYSEVEMVNRGLDGSAAALNGLNLAVDEAAKQRHLDMLNREKKRIPLKASRIASRMLENSQKEGNHLYRDVMDVLARWSP
ncbi:MAG: hypothetical protein RLO06_09055 [Parvibaculum sp.]